MDSGGCDPSHGNAYSSMRLLLPSRVCTHLVHVMTMVKKNILIVYAHQDSESFNAALKNVAKTTLDSKGYTVEVSDLYGQHFEPRATSADFTGADGDHFKYSEEQKKAVSNSTVSEDILKEMEKVKRADLIIFQFPMYWFSVPAILKGWFDRILANGFAYTYQGLRIYDEGLLKGKRAVLSLTTGALSEFFTSFGLNGDINVALWPLHYGTLRFCGFDVLKPQVSYAPQMKDSSEREKALQSWKTRLDSIFSEEPQTFIPLNNFDPQKGFVLKDGFVERESEQSSVPSFGHHMGKIVPSE